MTDQDWGEQLAKFEFLDHLSHQDRDSLKNFMEHKKELSGTKILRQGETGEEIYFLIEGEVKVTLEGEDTPEDQVLTYLSDGDVFGEMAAFSDRRRTASVEAVEDVEMLVCTAEKFKAICKRFPTIPMKLVSTLVYRLTEANRRINELKEEM